jgi:aminoglycoside 3'-phosphotransferase I
VSRLAPCDAPVLPAGLDWLGGGRWARDRVGESGAAVYRVEAEGRAFFLKHGTGPHADDVADEGARLRWLQGRMPVPVTRWFAAAGEEAWLLTDAVPGRTAYELLAGDAEPEPIVDALADLLLRLHALPAERCPFNAAHPLRLAHARERMEAGEVNEDDFGDAHDGWTAHAVWDEMMTLLPEPAAPVVTHGDFSLDNILLADGKVTGLIDLGRVGLADRYQDLAILWDSLGEFGADVQARMWRRYGIAAPDGRRMQFHLCLDEFF